MTIPGTAPKSNSSPDANWVRGQAVVFALAIFVPPLERIFIGPGYEVIHPAVTIVVGLLLAIAMFGIVGRARKDLAENFRVVPTPIEGGRLIDTGIYGWVRHPMYLAAVIGVFGWGIVWQSWSGLVITALAYLFFSAKARHEEQLLNARYSDYADYRRRVPGRLVPLPRRG